jgi:proteic killer suppression protein
LPEESAFFFGLAKKQIPRFARDDIKLLFSAASWAVIRSIRHKGLKRFHEDDDPRGVIVEHADKLRDILARLDAAGHIADMDLPGFRLHPLKGEFKGLWAVTVRANWRVIFRIANGDVLDVDYVDYHWGRLNHADEESATPRRLCLAPVHWTFGLDH